MSIHVNIHKTRTGGAVPIMNQYDMCQLVQKWFLVCWGRVVILLNQVTPINITLYAPYKQQSFSYSIGFVSLADKMLY